MPQEWWVRRGNHEQGPFSPQEIKSLVSTGKLTAADLVRTTTKPEWRAAGTVKGLFGKRVVTPPPLPQLENNSSPQTQSSSPNPQQSKSLLHWISMVGVVVLAVLYIAAKVNRFTHKSVSEKAKATEKQNVGIAEQNGGGQKLAAFRELVRRYKNGPTGDVSGLELQTHLASVKEAQDRFVQIPFDPKLNSTESKKIADLYMKEMYGQFDGQLPTDLYLEHITPIMEAVGPENIAIPAHVRERWSRNR